MIAHVHRYHNGDIGIDLSPAALLRLAAGRSLDTLTIPLSNGTQITIQRVDRLDDLRPRRTQDDRAEREAVEIQSAPMEGA